jgi:L-ribulose-5-phosphate 3-epimerase
MKGRRITRREMLVTSAGAVAGLALSSCTSVSTSSKSSPRNGFKIGACDWTLRERGTPKAFEVAKEIGLDGLQVSTGTNEDPMAIRTKEYRQALIRAAKQNNVEIGSVGMAVLSSIPLKSRPEAEELVSDAIAGCQALNVKVMLIAFFSSGNLFDKNKKIDTAAVDVVVERLKRLGPKAEEAGVVLGMESYLSAEQYADVLDRVNSPAVKVYYDVANSNEMGYDIYKEIRQLGDRICEFHLKDNKDLYGKGDIDFIEVRKAMDDIGYRGWVHIEGTKYPLGLVRSIRYDLEYLRVIFPPEV